MGLGFKLQYIYCWMCFVKHYARPLYITDNVVLENLNSIHYIDSGSTLYFSSELDTVNTILGDERIWNDVVLDELDMSLDEYRDPDFKFSTQTL